jgi:hypothetical protein
MNRFQLKTEDKQSGSRDDTALNGIKILCGASGGEFSGSTAMPTESHFGHWRGEDRCAGFYTGAQFRSEGSQGRGDDTGGNSLKLYCSSTGGDGYWQEGDGMNWGDWTSPVYCGANEAICGMKLRIEGSQGSGSFGLFRLGGGGDDTGLNAVQFVCCSPMKWHF